MSESETSTAPSARGDDAGSIVIIGAGPAGLTAAQELARSGVTSTVLESDDVVGGISRTVQRDGCRFDIGGHRFFTKVKQVEKLWHEILPDDDWDSLEQRVHEVEHRLLPAAVLALAEGRLSLEGRSVRVLQEAPR